MHPAISNPYFCPFFAGSKTNPCFQNKNSGCRLTRRLGADWLGVCDFKKGYDQGIIPFSTYLSGLKLLSYWVEPLSCLHSAHGPVLRQHVYYRVHKYSFQSPLNWHFWETLLNLFYPWLLWHLGLCHSWSYDRCGTCRLEFKRNWNTDDQKFHISYWTRSEKVKSWRKVI